MRLKKLINKDGLDKCGEAIEVTDVNKTFKDDIWIKATMPDHEPEYIAKEGEAPDYTMYLRKKKGSLQGDVSETVVGWLIKIDKWYAETAPQHVTRWSERFQKSKSGADRTWADYPENALQSLESYLPYIDGLEHIPPGDPAVTDMRKQIAAFKNKTREYIDSGKYAKHVEAKRVELRDSWHLPAPGMKDPALDAVVKRDYRASSGTLLRHSVSSRHWIVEKNGLGIPIKKYVYVDVAVKRGDQCFLLNGHIDRVYEGGGNYGSPVFYHVNLGYEMNCANVDK